jgi:hypothetical protein
VVLEGARLVQRVVELTPFQLAEPVTGFQVAPAVPSSARVHSTAHFNGTANTVTVTVGCHTISGNHYGSLNVTTPTCLAPCTQIYGTVTISGAGSLDAEGATIQGALTVERRWGCRRVGRFPGTVGADGSWCVPGPVWCWWAAAPCR